MNARESTGIAEVRPARAGSWHSPSNLLSIVRLLLSIPAGYALWHGYDTAAAVIFLSAAVTDVLDGWLARRYNDISELGKVIDPVADKIFVGTIAVMMLVTERLPLWFVAAVVARDLLIVVGGLTVQKRTGVVLPSNWPGKLAVSTLSLMLLFMVLHVDEGVIAAMRWLSLALLALSLGVYIQRAVSVMANTSTKYGVPSTE